VHLVEGVLTLAAVNESDALQEIGVVPPPGLLARHVDVELTSLPVAHECRERLVDVALRQMLQQPVAEKREILAAFLIAQA